jgi:uncharacterized phage infection (PIP) family protein YhgE
MAAASQPPAGQPAPRPADTAKQEQPASVAQVSPVKEKPRIKPAKASGLNRNTIFYAVSAVLVVALIVLGVFYGMGVGKINKANAQITDLTANVTSLEGQLTTAQATAADLQTQLTAAKGQVTSLTSDLATANAKVTSLTSDLATANGKVTSLTADLATANGKVTSLTADLASANTKVTSLTSDLTIANGKVATLQASLDKANSDLAAALVTNATQAATLRTIQYPRHFNSTVELTTFLAQDDTNTNPAYSGATPGTRAFILEIKALRAGFLLPAQFWWDSSYTIYSENIALVGASLYEVSPSTDAISYGITFVTPPPSYPIPLP